MDFDLSKENIKPQREGRNVSQLVAALQAQHSQERQQELLLQKQAYENAIRTYVGDDPLEGYYQFISWVEQSYPKHGHEGNLAPLLEDCLSKFENDKRYINDRRFCKIWIKFIDMQQNPMELYQMLYSRNIGKGCADLYRAWAYYHEAAGDFRSADMVFQTGRKELAQPMQDLVDAHESMVFAAGQQLINGVDEHRLLEQRQALTMLQPIRAGRVGSVRTAASSTPGIVPQQASSAAFKGNVPLQVYQDHEEAVLGAGAAPVSVLSAVKRDAAKENLMKPGTWTSGGVRRGASSNAHRNLGFQVHVDESLPPEVRGIQLSGSFYAVAHENFSQWKVDISVPDPDDPNKIPMYCKRQVYIDPTTEYSMEEVRARRYLRKTRSRLSVPSMETEQAIQSIMGGDGIGDEMDHSMHELEAFHVEPVVQHQPFLVQEKPSFMHHQEVMHLPSPYNSHKSTCFQNLVESAVMSSPQHHQMQLSQMQTHNSFHNSTQIEQMHSPHTSFHSGMQQVQQQQQQQPENFYAMPSQPAAPSIEGQVLTRDMFNDLWRSPNESQNDASMMATSNKMQVSKFAVFEESNIVYQEDNRMQFKGSAMKTPFKVLTDEDLAETGSRGGLDTAAAAQPTDGAKRLAVFENDDDSSNGFSLGNENTELFSLNAMHVSTPLPKQVNSEVKVVEGKCTKKQLFPEVLSMILEEKSGCSGSSNSGGSYTTKTSSNTKPINMNAIEEENSFYTSGNSFKVQKTNSISQPFVNTVEGQLSTYDFNLSQNSKANAELRAALLNNLNSATQSSAPPNQVESYEIIDDDDEEEENEEEEEEDEDFDENEIREHVPYPVLPTAPTDPFKADVIRRLVQHVGFPGRHKQGYVFVHSAPRLSVKKEPCYIGGDKFMVEKMLGKGTFGSVFKALRCATNETVALKIQKPPNMWEYYICRELQSRLMHSPLRHRFMNVHTGYFSDTNSVLLSDFCPYGSLLDVANMMRTKFGPRGLKQMICIFFTIEMLKIVEAMHEAKIIHADIKPDNFLVMLENNTLALQLIDFGCSIDMSLFPEGTMFTRRVTTEDFICCEMQEGRPWSYHTDLFCVAATAHVLLFNTYLQFKKKDNVWSITSRFTRYMRADMWNLFFSTLLNMQEGLPDIRSLKQLLTDFMHEDTVREEMREMVNTIKNR